MWGMGEWLQNEILAAKVGCTSCQQLKTKKALKKSSNPLRA